MGDIKLPLEMNYDLDNIGYINLDILPDKISKMHFKKLLFKGQNKNLRPSLFNFYCLPNNNDYILKIYNSEVTSHYSEIKKFISNLINMQANIKRVDFPIGYIIKEMRISGQIVRYYKNTECLKNLCIVGELKDIKKYYFHDEDGLHNLFLLYLDILSILEELFENNIAYCDVHGGNFVFNNNQVKLIDFDSNYTEYKNVIRYHLFQLLRNYGRMIDKLNQALGYNSTIDLQTMSFEGVCDKVKTLENNIRRYG